MRYFLLSACLFLSLLTYGQGKQEKSDTVSSTIYSYVEYMPVPDCGYNHINEYIAKHLQYPDAARRGKIEGRVIVKFVVNEDGSISGCQIIRGIGGGCDEEAIRIISNMPRWAPGKQNGKLVKVYFTQPVTFSLTD